MPIVQPRHHAGDRHTPNAADPHVPRRRALAGTGFRTLIAVTVLGLVSLALTTPQAQAATTCTGDACVVGHSVDTPLSPVTLTVSSANVVTATPDSHHSHRGIRHPVHFPARAPDPTRLQPDNHRHRRGHHQH